MLRRIELTLYWMAILLFSWHYGAMLLSRGNQLISSDFTIFYHAIKHYLAGKSLYLPTPWQDYFRLDALSQHLKPVHFHLELTYSRNLNTPFTMLFYLPFAYLSYSWAFVGFNVFSLILSLASIATIVTTLKKRFCFYTFSECVLGFIVFYPVCVNFYLGEPALLAFFFLTMAWAADQAGKPVLLGILLGICFTMKWFLGLFLVMLFLQKRWRVIGVMLLTFCILNVTSFSFFGWGNLKIYYQVLQEIYWYTLPSNESLYGFLTRLFGDFYIAGWVQWPWLSKGLYALFAAAIMAAYAKLVLRKTHVRRAEFHFSLTLCCALLLSPLTWQYYFVFLIFPLIELYKELPRFDFHLKQYGVLACILFSFGPIFKSQSDQLHQFSGYTLTLFALPFYGLLGLTAILGYSLAHPKPVTVKRESDKWALKGLLIVALTFGMAVLINAK